MILSTILAITKYSYIIFNKTLYAREASKILENGYDPNLKTEEEKDRMHFHSSSVADPDPYFENSYPEANFCAKIQTKKNPDPDPTTPRKTKKY